MVVEQVDFVNIQQPTIGLRQQAWLEAAMPFGQGVFEVE